MADRFEDERGVIQDLFTGPNDGVTEILTRKGAVRGNHVHDETTQWTLVRSGRLLVVTDDGEFRKRREYLPGEMAEELPGIAHAWKALEDTTVLVFTRGPRSGEAYESDTRRLAVPLL
jgi:quercetin dioxygenase-like cupin family protein